MINQTLSCHCPQKHCNCPSQTTQSFSKETFRPDHCGATHKDGSRGGGDESVTIAGDTRRDDSNGRVSSGHGTYVEQARAASGHFTSARPGHGPSAGIHIDERPVGGQSTRAAVMERLGSSREMVLDYIRYCLEKEGITWQNGQRDLNPNDVQAAMRALGDECDDRYGEDFDRNVSRLILTPEHGREHLMTVMRELFSDGEVSWGRIVALMVFTGKLAVQSAKRQPRQDQLLNSIVDWVSHYLDTDQAVRTWVSSNNGWAGLVEFHGQGADRYSRDTGSQLKTFFTVFAAAVGALTLGALMRS